MFCFPPSHWTSWISFLGRVVSRTGDHFQPVWTFLTDIESLRYHNSVSSAYVFYFICTPRISLMSELSTVVDNLWFINVQLRWFYARRRNLPFPVYSADDVRRVSIKLIHVVTQSLTFCNLQDKIKNLDYHDLCRHLRGVDEVSDGASQSHPIDVGIFSICSLTSVITVSPWS